MSSHINAVPYLALAMEQCWLTNTSKVVTHASERDKTLATRGCPTSEAISLHWEKGSSNSAFSFQVLSEFDDCLEFILRCKSQITEDLVGSDRFWIQCRMGLCSATNAGARGNIHRCVKNKINKNIYDLFPQKGASTRSLTVLESTSTRSRVCSRSPSGARCTSSP